MSAGRSPIVMKTRFGPGLFFSDTRPELSRVPRIAVSRKREIAQSIMTRTISGAESRGGAEEECPREWGRPRGHPAWKATLWCGDEVHRKNRRGARRNEWIVVQ